MLDLARVDEPVQVLSQIGLVFLFFLAGMEIAFHSEDERELGLILRAFGVSILLAIAVAHVLEAAGLVESPLLVGIVLAATAFGIVVAVLKDAGETRTGFGQLVIPGASVADFATVVLLSLFFSQDGSGIEATLLLLGLFIALVGMIGLGLHRARASGRLTRAVDRLRATTAQSGDPHRDGADGRARLPREEFGLEVVLGAFMAGAMVSLLDRDEALEGSGEKEKLDAIGFGVFIRSSS